MHEAVRECLDHFPQLPRQVQKFNLSDHEKAVLSAFEILKTQPFLPPHLDICEKTWQQYRVKIPKNDKVIAWALLLHDIGKNRGLDGPHPDQSGRIVRSLRDELMASMYISKEDMDRIEWLVRYHDVLGNINTGERFPNYIDQISEFISDKEKDLRLHMLQIITFCDLMGTSNGMYLTDPKAKFWIKLSSPEFRDALQTNILEFRIKRWTGNLQTFENPERAEELRHLVKKQEMNGLFQQIYGKQVYHVVHGIYLFVALSEHNVEYLFQLLKQSALHCLKLFPSECEIQLSFKSYKPWEKNAPKLLKQYQKSIQDKRLKFFHGETVGMLEVKVR